MCYGVYLSSGIIIFEEFRLRAIFSGILMFVISVVSIIKFENRNILEELFPFILGLLVLLLFSYINEKCTK